MCSRSVAGARIHWEAASQTSLSESLITWDHVISESGVGFSTAPASASADAASLMSCSCCGEDRPTATLRSRDDVALCRRCVGWLAGQLGVASTPTLPVADMDAAVEFYERAGFGVRRYIDESGSPGGFAFVEFDEESVFDLDAAEDLEPSSNRAGCYLITPDADAWHARMAAAGLPVSALGDQPWGMREFELRDPSGNRVRIGRPLDDGAD